MKDINCNPFLKFNNEWALVTSGSKDKFNSMTISWGSMGTLWHKPIVTIYVRPDRYTFNFLKKHDIFTISFYDEKYKKELGIMGRKSGRDIDKVKEINFSPVYLENGITYMEAYQTIVCKKIYVQQIDKNNIPDFALKLYDEGAEAHYIIIGEVIDII